MADFLIELLGFAAVFVGFLMFQQRDRKRLIFCKLLCDILWILHFLFLGANTIVCTTFISVLREFVFFNKDKPLFQKKIWLFLFVFLYATTPIYTWKGIYCIFPAFSSILATVAFWSSSVKNTKKISFCVAISQIIYEIAVKSYSAIINELISISSIVISFIRDAKNKNIQE